MEYRVPPTTVIELGFVGDTADLTVMCNGSRFVIDVRLEDLQDAGGSAQGPLAEQFVHFRDCLDDGVEAFEEWAVDPCRELIRQLSPDSIDRDAFTLQSYFGAPTFPLKLVNDDGTLKAVQHSSISGPVQRIPLHMSEKHLSIPSFQLQVIPRIKASQFRIVEASGHHGPSYFEYCAAPRAVQMRGSTERLRFQAASDRLMFSRELRVYLAFKDQSSTDHGIPKIQALVQWDDDDSIMGFVTDDVQHMYNIGDAASKVPMEKREQWMRQIEATVEQLHKSGLVWGDIKPESVLVDADDNARIVEFGGRWIPSWIDKHLQESREGDMQGLSKSREFLDLSSL